MHINMIIIMDNLKYYVHKYLLMQMMDFIFIMLILINICQQHLFTLINEQL